MTNATMTRTGDKLTVEIDLSQDIGPSKTGKTLLIAKTAGAESVPGEDAARINLQVYRYR